MFFALFCQDKPNAIQTRMNARMDHLKYVEDSGVVAQAGPLVNEEGVMSGSLIILDVDDLTAAQRWADGDPYKAADLFASVQIVQWNKVIG